MDKIQNILIRFNVLISVIGHIKQDTIVSLYLTSNQCNVCSCVGAGAMNSPINCDFEDPNMCGYIQDTTDNMNWNRVARGTSSHGTGPRFDHTYQTSAGELPAPLSKLSQYNIISSQTFFLIVLTICLQ